MAKKVSVIIPFYNRLDWLKEAVNSSIHQTHTNLEIIVVNDGSKEDMTQFLIKYQNQIIYIEKENGGAASARNLGIERATGEFIAFLDSDDVWLPNKIEKQIKYMETNNYVWSHTGYKTFSDESKKEIKYIDILHYEGDIYPLCIISTPMATPTIMIKSEVLKLNTNLRFPTNMQFGEDVAMWLSLAVIYPVGIINEPLCLVRIKETNASLNVRAQIKSRSQMLDYLNIHKKRYNGNNISPLSMGLFFKFSRSLDTFLDTLDKLKLPNKLMNNISKVLYVPIWFYFKYQKNKLLRMKSFKRQ